MFLLRAMWLKADFLSGPAQVKCRQRLLWRENGPKIPIAAAASETHTRAASKLLAVQLDDELLVDRKLQVLALGQGQNPACVIIAIDF